MIEPNGYEAQWIEVARRMEGRVSPPAGLQLDLLTIVVRLEQVRDEGTIDWRADPIAERIITCDLPRMRALLTPETLAWAAANDL
jgi:hypothetical protein